MVTEHDQLIEKLKSGSSEAGEYIYNTYAPELLGVSMRYVGNKADAEDILQESFIDIFQNIGKLKSNNALKSWMYRIVVNNSLAFLKKQPDDYNVDDISETYSDGENNEEPKDIKERILDSDISQDYVLSVINSLPTGFRTVFNLYVFEKMKHNEIAKQLNISVSTSKSQLLRARQLIQKKLYHNLNRQDRKEKKERFVFLFPMLMSNELNYIDDLMYEKLSALKITPSTEFKNVFRTEGTGTGSVASSGAKLKLAALAGKNTILVSSLVVGAAVAGTLYFNNPKEQAVPVAVADSVKIENTTITPQITDYKTNDSVFFINTPAELNEASAAENTNKAVIKEENQAVQKVYVKKVVKVKHQKVVTDTVIKSDTLHLY